MKKEEYSEEIKNNVDFLTTFNKKSSYFYK